MCVRAESDRSLIQRFTGFRGFNAASHFLQPSSKGMLASLSFLAVGTWTLLLGGDIMLNGIAVDSKPFEAIAETVRGADLAIANLEIPLTTQGAATRRKSAAELKARTQFILKADPAHGAHLAETGWDAVSLGNNHSMDYGPSGLEEMLQALAANGIAWAGAGADRAAAKRPATIASPSGVRLGLVSMLAYRTAGALWKCTPATVSNPGLFDLGIAGLTDPALAKRLRGIVQAARAQGDLVIVALHWGVERTRVPDAHQIRLGRAFIDAGADVVVGHHPHVLQGAELYQGKPILYSTGNLVSPRPSETALFRLTFDGARLDRFEALPCRISGGKIKPLAPKQAASAQRSFDALCEKIVAKYPNPLGQPLGADWKARP